MSGDGGPAFPIDTGVGMPCWGVSVRDYFAANALIGLIASPKLVTSESTAIANAAYTVADSMLAERAKAAQPSPASSSP